VLLNKNLEVAGILPAVLVVAKYHPDQKVLSFLAKKLRTCCWSLHILNLGLKFSIYLMETISLSVEINIHKVSSTTASILF